MSTAYRSEDPAGPGVPPLPPVLTFISPEGLAAIAEHGGTTIGAPVLLPGPSNGVHVYPDCPDCSAD